MNGPLGHGASGCICSSCLVLGFLSCDEIGPQANNGEDHPKKARAGVFKVKVSGSKSQEPLCRSDSGSTTTTPCRLCGSEGRS